MDNQATNSKKKNANRPYSAKKQGKGNLCIYYKKCGGCQLQNMSYEEQLSFKQAKCIKLLGKFCRVQEIIAMENPTHYRNKVQAAFGTTKGGKIISGVYQSSSHRIVCVDNCMIEDEIADAIIVSIRELIVKFKLRPYNEDMGKGFLRHVLVRRGFKSGQVLVVLVTGSIVFPRKNDFIEQLLKLHPEITSIVQNVNNRRTSLVLGETEKVLYGKGYIEDELCGCVFRISPSAFYQINPVQTEVLYNTAIEYAQLDETQTVIDAYCGVGTIGLVAAKKAKSVIGVELNPESVKNAKVNAKTNNAQNIRFVCADSGEFMSNLAAQGECIDVLFTDPPRAGSDERFLSCAVELAPKRIVYVSCNPETLARDLLYLVRHGYKVKKIQPVDMFPHTTHVECVVQLCLK